MAATPNPDALPGIPVLEQTPIIIEKIVWAATDEQMHWKPAMDRWSISEVLAHLAEAETIAFRDRIRLMIEKDNPPIEGYDQDAAYGAGNYSANKARENLKKFCHERDRSLSFLRYIPVSVLGRKGQHSKIGPITIGQIMNEWAFHDLGHIRQIAELYRAHAFYPHSGPFKQYYTVKP
ncbi:MAG TPA: DinB family protein [Candidatus Limnocylindrales bacterium]|nr:DinB family protein [Candidatus Limnocylindrales bacterium]